MIISPTYVKNIMQQYNLKFNKSLGQNFLIDNNILDKISSFAGDEDRILEIGAGIGLLSMKLSERAKSVVAVEIDSRFIEILNNLNIDNMEIINTDILKLDLSSFKGFKVIANLPYYITSPVIIRLLESEMFKDIYVLVQKEMANRAFAKPNSKDYSSFTVLLNYYADSEIMFNIPPTVFMPKPKVESSLLRLTPKTRTFVKDTGILFKLIRKTFNNRRKTLANTVSDAFNIKKEYVGHLTKRPENLSLEEFIDLADFIAKIQD